MATSATDIISLDMAKEELGLTAYPGDEYDARITRYINQAVNRVDSISYLPLINKSITKQIDIPDIRDPIYLREYAIRTSASVTVKYWPDDTLLDGSPVDNPTGTLASADLYLDSTGEPVYLIRPKQRWPILEFKEGILSYMVGVDTDKIPPDVIGSIILLIRRLYDGLNTDTPDAAWRRMLAPYRTVSV